jgi:hypothetical protein
MFQQKTEESHCSIVQLFLELICQQSHTVGYAIDGAFKSV